MLGVSGQVIHKPGCIATEDGEKLQISDLESRGTVHVAKTSYCTADLCHCFCICKKQVFS